MFGFISSSKPDLEKLYLAHGEMKPCRYLAVRSNETHTSPS